MWFRPFWFRDMLKKGKLDHSASMDYTQNGTVKNVHARYGVLCDPFGLDHSATDRCYPHLSLCGANSFFFELDHSASHPFMWKCTTSFSS